MLIKQTFIHRLHQVLTCFLRPNFSPWNLSPLMGSPALRPQRDFHQLPTQLVRLPCTLSVSLLTSESPPYKLLNCHPLAASLLSQGVTLQTRSQQSAYSRLLPYCNRTRILRRPTPQRSSLIPPHHMLLRGRETRVLNSTSQAVLLSHHTQPPK